MRTLSLFTFLLLFYPCTAIADDGNPTSTEKVEKELKPPPPPGQFALIELFTSQACSSCPQADTLLRKITEQAENAGKPLYTLSFHVDYWNNLGWKDPYSLLLSTKRQKQYVYNTGGDNAYTPQIIVNGKVAVVGTDKKALAQAIKEVESDKHSVVDIQWSERFKSIKYNIKNQRPANAELNIVGYKPFQENEVLRGENQGKTLSHVNVVKFITSFPVLPRGWGRKEISFPEAVKNDEVKLLAILQNPETGEVYGVSKLPNYEDETEENKNEAEL